MEQVKQIFNELFKFKNNQPLRHKGDNKSSHSTDMGLLAIHRLIVEDVDEDGNQKFEKLYHCRVVRFSGSGEVMQFKERELLSMEEYHQEQLKEEQERNEMRERMKRTEAEIYKAYGVSKNSVVKLKSDKENEYNVCGFKSTKETGIYELSLHSVGGLSMDRKEVFIKSPDEIDAVS